MGVAMCLEKRCLVHTRSPRLLRGIAASELGAAVDTERFPGDPARVVGGQEDHCGSDVLWLGHTLQRLHAERHFTAR